MRHGMEEAMGLHHDHAGSAAVRMAVGQPEEGHPVSLSLPAAAATPQAALRSVAVTSLRSIAWRACQIANRSAKCVEASL
jgi:hypothetical protein